MRKSPNDTGGQTLDDAASGAVVPDGPIRKCILSGEHGSPDTLVRLAIGPDGAVLPDVRAKAPGRGAWLGVDRATLEQAMVKGKLRGALARAFKGAVLTVPDDLADRIDKALVQALLDRLGLEARGGKLLTGSDRIQEAARRGQVKMLLHAADASRDGNGRLDQAWRVGMEREGQGDTGTVLPVDRAGLSVALGRDNVVHVALTDRAAANRIAHFLGRLIFFRGVDAGAFTEAET